MTRKLHTIDPKKKYILLCSKEDLGRIFDDGGLPEDSPVILAMAVENGRIVDLEDAKKLIDKQAAA